MSLVRIYQKPEGTPASNDLFIFESQTGGVYYDKKVKWTTLMGLIAAINNLQNYYLKTETYTKTEVNQLIAAIPTFSIEVVQELPTEDISQTTIYLVPKQDAGTLDYYDEWINLDGTTSGWEWLGKTEVDLSNYYTKSETEAYVKGDGADYIVGTKTYSSLTTTVKTVLGALNEIKQTADGAASSATSAGQAATAAQGTADAAASAASAAQGTADTALSTAQGAASAAAAAQGTANNAVAAIGALATVASTGDYNDLINKPNIDAELSEESEHAVQNKVITAALYARDDAYLLSQLDGTKATYDRIMREWFNVRGVRGASDMTPAELTALCCEWYEKTVKEWDGSVTFDQPDYAGGSTGMYGTKGGDNAGLTCIPSTDTTHNTDDYEGLPLFACVDVNYVVDATSLDILITEIDGVTDGFVRDDADVFVGVMQATGWHWQSETEETYTHGYRSSYLATYSDIVPLPEAVRVDGTVRPFVVHSKYMSTDNSGKLTSCSGVYVKAFESHNTIHTKSATTGAQYSGSTTADDYFLKLMAYIKYGRLSLDGIMNGCNDYNLQYYAQVAETGVKRIILPSSSALVVGSTVIIGTYNGTSTDRGTAANYNISGAYGWKILSIEDVTIGETAYKAVYVDTPEDFNTTANGSAVSGTTIVSTWHWMCGSCDSVKGNDGSPGSNTNNLIPFRLQGVEYMVGGYEVKADVIMNIEAITSGGPSNYIPYTVARTLQQSTAITQNYAKLSDLAIECPASTGWQYIKKLKFKNGVAYPNIVGGSSTTYTKDAFYMNNNATTGAREWLAFGTLINGPDAGLSFLIGNVGLTLARWYCLPRLSPNGNRGEWSA